MTVFEKGNVGGDLVKSCFNPIVSVESRDYTNAGLEVEVFAPGYPWSFDDTDATPLEAADVANVEGINYQELRVEAGESVKVALLTGRENVALNKDVLPENDIADAAYNATNFQNALIALGFVMRSEPVTQEEQTT